MLEVRECRGVKMMKCPRCAYNKLKYTPQGVNCSVCNFYIKPKRAYRWKQRLEKWWHGDTAARKVWNFNLEIYKRIRLIMAVFTVIVFVSIMTVVIQSVGLALVSIISSWFAGMTAYDLYLKREAKK